MKLSVVFIAVVVLAGVVLSSAAGCCCTDCQNLGKIEAEV